MQIDRVLLISAPIDDARERCEAVNNRCFAPLGLLAIATRLRRKLANLDVRVVDGDLLGQKAVEALIDSFRPQVVGLSTLTPTYSSSLAIARYARAAGVAHVVMGNDHVSFFPEFVVARRPEVSFVISGDDGDVDFTALVTALRADADPYEVVPNLHGMAMGKPRASATLNRRLSDKLTSPEDWPDPSLLDRDCLAKFQENYVKRFGRYHRGKLVRPLIVNNAKGCYKAKDRCLYCSIFDLQTQWGDVRVFWEAIRAYGRAGYNFFFEVCDNLGSLTAYRRQLAAGAPGWFDDSDIELMVYTDANVINRDRQVLEDFARLHVTRVNMGLDAGDPTSLRALKGFRDSGVNERAISALGEAGVQIHCSFVLGAPAETEESLACTLELVEHAIRQPHVVAVEVSPLFPLPGSPVWQLFLGDFESRRVQEPIATLLATAGKTASGLRHIWTETRKHFLDNDLIDLTLAAKLWADHFTEVGNDTLTRVTAELNAKIARAGKVTGGFG